MGKSAFISAALHMAVLLWVIVAFPSAKMESAPMAIPVDLATPSDVTKAKAGMSDADDVGPLVAKPEPPKPKPVREKSKPEPEPKPEAAKAEKLKRKEAAPKPESKPDAPAKEVKQAKAAPSPVPRPTRKPKPPPKTEAKKRDFNADRIAALLNKIPDAADAPEPQDWATETNPVHGQSDGTQLTMTINELDALRARIAACWSPPPGGLGAEEIVVKIRLRLNEDGTLIGYPSIANNGTSAFFQAAADSAVRAVFQCQPYMLPKEKYALWRDMILNFDPSDMYGSG